MVLTMEDRINGEEEAYSAARQSGWPFRRSRRAVSDLTLDKLILAEAAKGNF
jgi:hypothetical protein